MDAGKLLRAAAAVVVQGPPIQNAFGRSLLGALPILFVAFISRKVVVLLGCVIHRESARVALSAPPLPLQQLQGEGGL